MDPLVRHQRDRLGRPVRDLRISVTDRCNYRCGYCMPAETFGERYQFLPRPQILTFEEIARVAQAFGALGVAKVRLTGGEPLLRAQLSRLVRFLAEIDGLDEIALTTNGALLARWASSLADAGLDRVTVSLDSIDPERYRRLSGRDQDLEPVLRGIDAAHAAGLTPLKINCVVQRGINDDGLVDLVRHFEGTGVIVRFIEFMDVGNVNGWDPARVVRAPQILARLQEEFDLEPIEPNYPGEVARRYRRTDGGGEIGIIASVSQPFCGGCTRARLAADGRLYTCLFASQGVDLRVPLRDGRDDHYLRELIGGIWAARSDRYSELRRAQDLDRPAKKVEMYHIGG